MTRRRIQLFNLSLLDLLTSALGAVIFLFIITPKGGAPASNVQQAVIYFDTTKMQVFGDLHDSLRHKQVGDTLFAVLVDYRKMPGTEERPPRKVFNEPERVRVSARQPREEQTPPTPIADRAPEKKPVETPAREVKTTPEESDETPAAPKNSSYRGDAPSVPCKVSFEINWDEAENNVDLFVCKGSSCVYGGRKKDRAIGQWDSGKSRNRLFGNDLRTNQEAVRQFDDIIPGEYKLYAQFKESRQNRNSVLVKGLIYTKDSRYGEKGEVFSHNLTVGKGRILLGSVILQENGNFQFIKK